MAMSIEITPGLIATAVGWISSSLTAAWILSRRSKQWDEVEEVVVAVFGDRKTGQKGLALKHDDLQADVDTIYARQRGALRGLHANFLTEKEVEDAVKHSLDQISKAKCSPGAGCLRPNMPNLTPMPMVSPLRITTSSNDDDDEGSGSNGP